MPRSARSYPTPLGLVVMLVASILPAGCGGVEDTLPREAITGTVKFNGEPLKAGRIQFQPAAQGSVTAGVAPIADGDYAIATSEGLVPGKYQVLIFGAPAQAEPPPAKSEMPGDTPPPRKPIPEPIPAKYNAQSKLSADVTKGGPNKFDFELTPK